MYLIGSQVQVQIYKSHTVNAKIMIFRLSDYCTSWRCFVGCGLYCRIVLQDCTAGLYCRIVLYWRSTIFCCWPGEKESYFSLYFETILFSIINLLQNTSCRPSNFILYVHFIKIYSMSIFKVYCLQSKSPLLETPDLIGQYTWILSSENSKLETCSHSIKQREVQITWTYKNIF